MILRCNFAVHQTINGSSNNVLLTDKLYIIYDLYSNLCLLNLLLEFLLTPKNTFSRTQYIYCTCMCSPDAHKLYMKSNATHKVSCL